MIRKLTKTLYACAYSWSQAQRWATGNPAIMPFIADYHRVVEDFDRAAVHAIPAMLTSAKMLENHVDWIARRYQIAPLDDIGAHLESGRPFRKPTAAITFDDGYRDVYRNAFPLLKRKGIPAAVFVVTDLVGTSRVQIYDRLFALISGLRKRHESLRDRLSQVVSAAGVSCPRLAAIGAHQDTPFCLTTILLTTLSQEKVDRIVAALENEVRVSPDVFSDMSQLSWEMVDEMRRSGITIGSHTLTHTLLTQENRDRRTRELASSKGALEARLGCEIKHFAYPDGRFDGAIVAEVNAAGYRYAYSICRTRDSRYPLLTIPRKVLWEKACLNAFGLFSPALMECHAHWAFDPLRRCSHDHGAAQSCHEQLITA
jgi:peptidoglycan/xylan/chitin deacetylase (PgdA/CDA1 family)